MAISVPPCSDGPTPARELGTSASSSPLGNSGESPENGGRTINARTDHDEQEQRPRAKRRRIGYACNLCRAKKNRCDGDRPTCGPCKARRHACVYSPQRTRVSVTQEYVDSLRERNRVLEEHLAAQHNGDWDSSNGIYGTDTTYGADYQNPCEDDQLGAVSHQPPTGIPSLNSEGRASENATKSAVSLPRKNTQFTSTVGDTRPSVPALETPSSETRRQCRLTGNGEQSPGEYFGESSAFDFIARVGSPNNSGSATGTTVTKSSDAKSAETAVTIPSARRQSLLSGYQKVGPSLNRQGHHTHAESLAGSSPSTVVFEEFLGANGAVGAFASGSNPFELPQRSLADKLVSLYFAHRHPLNPYLHEGTFRQRYERLWMSLEAGGEEATLNNVVWLGLVNMVFAFGSDNGTSKSQTFIPAGVATSSSSNGEKDRGRFFARAKTLVLSGILQAGKIELVQALLLMGHYLHGSLELNHCWTVVGLAVRTAQELGLHLDPAQFTDDIVEQEIRKRVWWGCFALDRQISIKVGRPPIISDSTSIQADLPLPVDDEFLTQASGYKQPSNLPSKLEFFRHIVSQCRLIEKVLETLYNNRDSGAEIISDTDNKRRMKTDLPDLLATSVQLDGALAAWQVALPPHLRPECESPEWHFQRQRSMLLMRFLHTRLLIHRQTLLHYISRRISDPFQLDLIRLCIKRCVMAAYESITQMRILRQRKSLSSFWHNSHYVFAALGVLLVFQKIDLQSRIEMRLPSSLDLDDVIAHGLENLQRVGGEMHPLATRYVQSFGQLQSRLQALATLSVNAPGGGQTSKPPPTRSGTNTPGQSLRPDISYGDGAPSPLFGQQSKDSTNVVGRDQTAGDYIVDQNWDAGANVDGGIDPFTIPGFDDEFEILQSVLLDSGEWPVFMDFDWQ